MRKDLWGVPILLAVAMLANAGMVPLVPFALVTRLSWPLWLTGWYSFAVIAVTMLMNHRISAIVDDTKHKALLCLMCALCQLIGALAAVGALSGATWLLVLTAVGSAAGGALAPVYYTLGRVIASGKARSSGAVNSWLRVVTSAAWVVGPALAFAIAGTYGIRSAFVMIAAVSAVGALAVVLAGKWLDSVAAVGQGQDDAGSASASGASGVTAGFRLTSLIAFSVVVLFSLAHIATAVSLPLFLVRRFAVPESATGLLLGLKAGVEMVAILITPLVAGKLSSRALLSIAGIGALIAYSAYLFGHGVTWAVFAAACEGAYYGLFALTALTWVQSLSGMRLGQATGFYMNGIYAGVLIGAPLSGLVASFHLGWIAGLSLIAALLALGVLAVSHSSYRRKGLKGGLATEGSD